MTDSDNWSSVITTDHKMPPRITVIGVGGIGKTTFAANSRSPIFIQTEDGLGDLSVPAFPLVKTLYEFNRYINMLLNNEHEYQTLVIDSADWLDQMVIASICKDLKIEGIGDLSHGKGYTRIAPEWSKIFTRLNQLRKEKRMTIIFTAHPQTVTISDPRHGDYSKSHIKMQKGSAALLEEWCDVILHCDYEMHVLTEDSGFNAKKRAVGTGNRIMHTTSSPAFTAKSRYALPEVLPLSWKAFEKAFFAARKEATQPKPTPKEETSS